MAGKWSIPGVPHEGWTCTSVEDLGAPDEVCEMCETQDIRYVHHMEHPDYPETLAVGSDCAEHLKTTMKVRAAARRHFAMRRSGNDASSVANGRSQPREMLI